jgi:16S rRNA (cytidine1402-2'-O)-methyltransferase
VIYEAPSRVGDTLAELAATGQGGGERATVVARELTKQYEELRRGTLATLAAYYQDAPPRGEVVIVIAGAAVPESATETDMRARASELRAEGLSPRDVAATLASEMGASRNLAYRLAHE